MTTNNVIIPSPANNTTSTLWQAYSGTIEMVAQQTKSELMDLVNVSTTGARNTELLQEILKFDMVEATADDGLEDTSATAVTTQASWCSYNAWKVAKLLTRQQLLQSNGNLRPAVASSAAAAVGRTMDKIVLNALQGYVLLGTDTTVAGGTATITNLPSSQLINADGADSISVDMIKEAVAALRAVDGIPAGMRPTLLINTPMLNKLTKEPEVTSRDYTGEGNYPMVSGKVYEVYGCDIRVYDHLPLIEGEGVFDSSTNTDGNGLATTKQAYPWYLFTPPAVGFVKFQNNGITSMFTANDQLPMQNYSELFYYKLHANAALRSTNYICRGFDLASNKP